MEKIAKEYLDLHTVEIQELHERLEVEFFNDMLLGRHGAIHDDGDQPMIEISSMQSRTGHPVDFYFSRKYLE